jgi:hypothetical protein
MVIHLEYRLPGTSRDLPGSYGRTTLLMLLYLVLLQVGFTKLLMSPSRLVSSYLTVSPLPTRTKKTSSLWAVYSLWHFPSRCRDWVLPSTLSCGARTFLPFCCSRTSDHPSALACLVLFFLFNTPSACGGVRRSLQYPLTSFP